MMELLGTGGHLLTAATIDDHHLRGTEAQSGAYGIDGGIPRSDDGHALACIAQLLLGDLLGTHHVQARQIVAG